MAVISSSDSVISPWLPTPVGISAKSASASSACRASIAARLSPLGMQRTPQEMSKPTPPAETIPPWSGSKAATPPIGKP